MVNKTLYILFLMLISLQFANGQKLVIPENYSIIDSISGDLDNDSVNEIVIAYNTTPEYEMESVIRELIIYKLENNKWTVWKKSSQALYASLDGGMMGDPFGEMEIKNGIIHISHNGGSSWKWRITDKYRFQDGEFYLIGFTSFSGKPCEYWEDFDFNLSTGKMIFNKEFEDCESEDQKTDKKENETLYEKGLKITLQNRQEKEIKITSPKYGHEIYIAIGKE